MCFMIPLWGHLACLFFETGSRRGGLCSVELRSRIMAKVEQIQLLLILSEQSNSFAVNISSAWNMLFLGTALYACKYLANCTSLVQNNLFFSWQLNSYFNLTPRITDILGHSFSMKKWLGLCKEETVLIKDFSKFLPLCLKKKFEISLLHFY